MGYPGRGKADYFAPGEHNVACFQCGRKFKSSQMFKHWQGYLVCRDHWEPRHPQDYVKSVPDQMGVPNAQPQADTFVNVCTMSSSTAYAGLGTAGCMTVGNTPTQAQLDGFGIDLILPFNEVPFPPLELIVAAPSILYPGDQPLAGAATGAYQSDYTGAPSTVALGSKSQVEDFQASASVTIDSSYFLDGLEIRIDGDNLSSLRFEGGGPIYESIAGGPETLVGTAAPIAFGDVITVWVAEVTNSYAGISVNGVPIYTTANFYEAFATASLGYTHALTLV